MGRRSSKGKDNDVDKAVNKLKNKLSEYIRVLKLARKPGKEEFWQVSKIVAIGILLVGSLGFITYLGMSDLPEYFAKQNYAEIQGEFLEGLDPDQANQTLLLQITNTDDTHETGELNLKLDAIEADLVGNETQTISSIQPGQSEVIEIEIQNAGPLSNVVAYVWGEDVWRHTSEEGALEINLRGDRPPI
ncbi:protein translocase SEC61 complex subunit gamma [Methanonatronarchaeum sp. AMET6-2]|uniref:protein translocase SEC61 complex subunit gamma n=1 Tax=Methanonatronarchaeum sp. AMET6-2 TaxID=2933293 RepID=UPI001FF21D62|nr:protein translocase SEC61 complex subunit gamma [Methanonatronarchaeum sp. AMET6-2]UOY10505.1 protein translocase SEC61 complex subunit gamma [Methanonatronarchaeum sp. AMET6-2]